DGLVAQPVGLAQLFGRVPLAPEDAAQRVLGHLPVGEIAGHLGEAAQLAVLVAKGGDHDVGPETAAVLAYPPAFVLDAPLGGGHGQLLGRLADPHVLGGIEDREVAADDLVGPVSLQPLGPGVPAGDPAVGVEHEDGVVLSTVDEEPEPLFALAGGLLASPTFGEIAGDLAEADELAVFAP